MHRRGLLAVLPALAALAAFALLASPATAGKPQLEGPSCTSPSAGQTACQSTLPAHGPAPALVFETLRACNGVTLLYGPTSSVHEKGDLVTFEFPALGTYLIAGYAKNGRLLFEGSATTC